MSQCGRVTDFRALLEKLGDYFNLPEVSREGENEQEDLEEKENPKETEVLSASFTVSSAKITAVPVPKKKNLTRRMSLGRSLSSNRRNCLAKPIIEAAVRAERTFRLQAIFDPRTRKRQRLTEATPTDLAEARLNEETPFFAYAGK